jgi:hypothetical protein
MRSIDQIIASALVIGVAVYKYFSKREYPKYSYKWIEQLSDHDWAIEREIVRKKYCSPEFDIPTRVDFKRILDLFDKVRSNKLWDGKPMRGPAYHREHGFNLYKSDD